jgi:hypothetical protein
MPFKSQNHAFNQGIEKKDLFFILKGKTLRALGRYVEARSAYTHFLGVQE